MNLEPINFLLVDDTEQNLIALEALLRRDGLNILTARSGFEALELLLVHDVALAFLDVQMPGMDGFELAELMRGTERTKNVPIIFVTAGARDSERVFQGYESGAVDFLHKPIDPRVLRSKADVFFELSKQRRDCTHALRLNEMFVGILGHDLRTPLSAIQTGTEILEQLVSDEDQRGILRRMFVSGLRMNEMIEQLLDRTRARLAGGLGFARARKRIDVVELVQRAVDELRTTHSQREVRVELHGDTVTAGDPDRLVQALSNLIGNALQHGLPDAPVGIRAFEDGHQVAVEIHNRGLIPSELLPVLFDPFRGRHHASRSGARGLGLGLYIAQQIAQAHGGTVAVVSGEDTHTVFTLRLPRVSPEPVHAELAPRGHTVLIADDDEVTRESLREAFEGEGYATITAADGREALDVLLHARVKPDLVILDLVMPLLEGGQVYQAMRAAPELARIPVIVSTSDPTRAPAGTILIPKPVKLGRLLATAARLIRSP
ncbi:His Kinase A (phospho-acceptor) domain-containing protein [Nannocystis exedens]|uniref:histidine kinase n=1 Tax=Nannocystis exedens TaxID=54 RepID=A0A1I2IE14_9BACT|nr:hybrid sensor histidine kinase/response regulator [Nannocystis exedens]PCC67140.1 hybrid sensor histidine kinase/response regulator [Nannocystis exedens]SFF39888.1 His Kinase A (phospho-acceptor) domain-containing protein [Nannocystis exedens]